MNTIFHSTSIRAVECCDCGMVLGLSKTWMDNAREAGKFQRMFYCPYCGTKQGWGTGGHEIEIKKLKDEAHKLSKQIIAANKRTENAYAEADHFKRSRDATKGVITKIKKRIHNGVCPCCNRSFTNLERHMKSKHPSYTQ